MVSVDAVLDTCFLIHRGLIARRDGCRIIRRNMIALRRIIPGKWRPFLLAEIDQIISEIINPDSLEYSINVYNRIVNDRLANVFAMKAIRYYSLAIESR